MILFCWLAALAALAVQLIAAADKFSCEGRPSGYYADVDTGCQVYHMCDGLGRQFSYSCPNTTLFQQRMLICDHWYMVNCSKSELDYNANLLIGQRDKPFVEDSSEHPYHRTPRPDLLQQPYAPRYQDEEYRQGRAQSLSATLNLVGVATGEEEDENGNPKKNFTTNRPQYFLPSHWSTQYGKDLTTPLPVKGNTKTKQNYGNGGKITERKLPTANFSYDPKYYKATKNTLAPVTKNPTTSLPKNTILPAAVPTSRPVLPSLSIKNNQAKKFSSINNSDAENIPDTINEASVSPSSLALPPFSTKIDRSDDVSVSVKPIAGVQKPSLFYQPPKFSSNYDLESTTMDPQTFYKLVPSKILLPPVQSHKIEDRSSTIASTTSLPTTTTQRTINKKDTEQKTEKIDSDKRWKELRQMFFIPEYDFPLEVASRPSYESGLSSFQVNPAPPNPETRRDNIKIRSGSSGLNPDCPKCDPAFLAPGTCKPCVMIRR